MNAQAITSSLAAPSVAVVATGHRNGAPHLAPHGYCYDGQALTLITRTDRLKYRNLQRAPRLSVCIDDPPVASKHVVIAGTAACRTQGIWDEARRIIARDRAPEEGDASLARWHTEPRVLVTVTTGRLSTRASGRW